MIKRGILIFTEVISKKDIPFRYRRFARDTRAAAFFYRDIAVFYEIGVGVERAAGQERNAFVELGFRGGERIFELADAFTSERQVFAEDGERGGSADAESYLVYVIFDAFRKRADCKGKARREVFIERVENVQAVSPALFLTVSRPRKRSIVSAKTPT